MMLDPTEPGSVLTSLGREDGFVASFNADGSFNWAERFGSRLADGINAVAIDDDGTVIVGGAFSGTVDFDILNGGSPLTAAGRGRRTDGFIAAYDLSGNCLWARGVGGAKNDAVYGVAVDGQGTVVAVDPLDNVIAGGELAVAVTETVRRGRRTSTRIRWQDAAFAVKLDPAGSIRWSASFPSSGLAGGDDGDHDDHDDDDEHREGERRRYESSRRRD